MATRHRVVDASVTCFPRSVWADRYPEPKTNGVTTHSRASKKVVVIERRVTHAGFVEVTSHV